MNEAPSQTHLALMWLGRAPRYFMNIGVFVTALIAMWATTVPGWDFLLSALAAMLTVLLSALWIGKLALFLWCGRKTHLLPGAKLFLIAPAIAVIATLAISLNLPFEMRWAHAKDSFSTIASNTSPLPAQTDLTSLQVPERIGTYKIDRAQQAGDAVIFFETTGSLSNFAGFAYLPSGPFAELENGSFERPDFIPIGDDWYRWTASW